MECSQAMNIHNAFMLWFHTLVHSHTIHTIARTHANAHIHRNYAQIHTHRVKERDSSTILFTCTHPILICFTRMVKSHMKNGALWSRWLLVLGLFIIAWGMVQRHTWKKKKAAAIHKSNAVVNLRRLSIQKERREEKEKTIRRRLKKMNETHGVWDIRQIWTHLCKCHAQKINKLVVCRIDYVCCIVFSTHIFCWLQNKSHLGKLAAKLRAPFH